MQKTLYTQDFNGFITLTFKDFKGFYGILIFQRIQWTLGEKEQTYNREW